ncbi:MAG: TIR domain-containing protein [Alphaproteobacteria bacterium]|nr:TIR domain-containing protein [Alphaproteobacteria bacterium]
MADIVLAYAPQDGAAGAAVGEALAAAGFDVRADPPPSARSRLAKRAAEAHAVVVLWSRHAAASPSVLRQAAQARQAGKLVGARLGKVTPPPLGRGAPAVDLSAHDGLDDLLAALRPPATPTPVVAAPLVVKPAPPAKAKGDAASLAPAANTAVAEPRKRASALPWVLAAILVLCALAAALLLR